MAGIICKWLNYEVKLSKFIEYGSIGKDFSNGFLFAQIFWRYGLIDSLDEFTDFEDSESIKKNFSLLEPVWEQLDIKTTEDIINDIQRSKTSTVIEQLYKMFVNIESQKCHIKQLVGTAREVIIQQDRNAAVKEIEQSITNSVEACWRLQDMMSTREMQLNVKLQERQEKTKKLLEGRSQRIAEQLKQFNASSRESLRTDEFTKPSYVTVEDYLANKKLSNKQKEVKNTYAELDEFEHKSKFPHLHKKPGPQDVCLLLKPRLEKALAMQAENQNKIVDMSEANFKWNQDYLDRIRLQLNEELKLRLARKQRKKHAIEEQLQLFQGTEREQIEEVMVEILLRQSKFEKKLINELMLIRKEKAIILESRRLHAKQLADMREKEFANALDLEERRAEVDRIYRDAQVANDWQFHKLLLNKHKEQCQKKHYEICAEIVNQIVDLSLCVNHHLTLIGNKIPSRLWREWKVLFIHGKPFFSHVDDPLQLDEPWELAVEDIQKEEDRLNALDEAEFQDYKNRTNDWEIPLTCDVEQMSMKRSILGHIVHTILNQVYVFPPPPRIPEFPHAPFKLCIMGKPFIGKTAMCEDIVNALSPMPIRIISPQNALEEALQAYHDVEDIIISSRDFETLSVEGTSDYFDPVISPSTSSMQSVQEQNSAQNTYKFDSSASFSKLGSSYHSDDNIVEKVPETVNNELTPLAVLGYLAWNVMKQGNEIDDNIIVKIILETVRQLPEDTSWILDGAPINIHQVKYLEAGMSAYYTPEDLYILHTAQDKEPNIYELRLSHLVSNPDPFEPPVLPKCSFDLIIYLDVEDNAVLEKASNHIASTEVDWDFSQLSIHQRLKKFNEDWIEVKQWFESTNALQTLPLNIDLQQDEEVLSTIITLIQDILTEKQKEKEMKLTRKLYSDSKGEEYFFIHGVNDKSIQFPTPSITLQFDSNTSRLAAGQEEIEDTLLYPTYSETEVYGSSTNVSEGSQSLTPSTIESVISSLVVSLSDMRPAQPGDANWKFIKETIPLDVATNIAKIWQHMEMGYLEILKRSFRKIRQYQDCIIQTFYNLQLDFKQFLQRPDNKQDYVNRWQEEYNSLDDDMRSDEETKSELHMRVDDLRHVLWEIADQRLQESKHELCEMASSGWLDDWLILMSNRYICLLQAEVDRFYDTLIVITDYYDGTEGNALKELPTESTFKVHLLDMCIEHSDSNISITSNPTIQCHQKNKADDDDTGGMDDYSDSVMRKTYATTLAGIERRLSRIYQGLGNEYEPKSYKGRGKGLPEDILSNIQQDVLTAGVKQLTEPKEKINLEYFAAIAEEECRVKTNIWLIEYVGMYKSGEFNKHSSRVYGYLERLLGAKFQNELDAIEQLCRAMGYAIEQEKPIQEELVLNDDIFFINADIILFPTHVVDSEVSTEETGEEGFTVKQILELCKQFFDIAPTGFITTYQLENIFNDIIAKDNYLEIIPDDWVSLKPFQIHKLMDYISGGQEFINWRLFLLYLAKPWPQPTEIQLIATLDQFHAIDNDSRGTINKLQYDKQVELWLHVSAERADDNYALSENYYSRLTNIKRIIFEIFNLSKTNPYIEYFDMLNHFAANDDPILGFTNAIALACGYPISSDVKKSQSTRSLHMYSCKTDKFKILENIIESRQPSMEFDNEYSESDFDLLNSDECPVPFSVVFHAFQYTKPAFKECNRMDLTNAEHLLEDLENIFLELGSFDCQPIPYSSLIESTKLRKKILETTFFKELDIYSFVHELSQPSVEDTLSLYDETSLLGTT